MITNKDISIDSENGKVTLNGNKYDLGTQGEIDTAVKDVYSVMGQNGAKNLIPYPYNHTTKTQNGVTFTDNGDGTITIVTSENGATANTTFEFQTRTSEKLFLKAGKYTATGCPLIAGGGIIFRITNTNVSPSLIFDDTGSGVTFTLQNDLPFGAIFTVIKDTVITTPIVVKPMLRLASDTDNTYEPYAMTNKQLTEQLGALSDRLIVVNGTLAATADSAVIQYPSGVNKTDWYVIGWNFTLNNNKYSGFGIGGADKSLSIVMGDENISVYNDDTALFSKSISIILAKL